MRLKTIAVGVDFSPTSDLAVRQAAAVARHAGGRLLLLHVGLVPEHLDGVPPSMEATAATYRAILQRRLDDDRARLETLRGTLVGPGLEVSHAVVDGFPDSGLADAAQELGADLLVVGSHGRTGLKRWLLGSVSEKTIRVAGTSVLVVRGDETAPADGFRKIVVGTDFSAHGDDAIRGALALAAPGADVHAVHCWQAPGPDLGVDAGDLAAFHATLATDMAAFHREQGAALLARHAAAPVTLRFDAIQGAPAATLDDVAAAENADLIVVGSHGRRGVRLLLLGSVAEATVRHAPCSVLVAR
jgi:nucleotide-binding universal stress UspA family protein